MRIFIFLLIVFLLPFHGPDDEKVINRNFDFEVVPLDCNNWRFNSKNGIICYSNDEFVNGKTSILFKNEPYTNKAFSSHIFQYLQLPILPEIMHLSLFSKSQFIKSAWLKIYTFDKEENIKSKDSISIVSPAEWRSFELVLKPENAQKIFIEIDVYSDASKTSQIESKLFLDKIELKLNDKIIDTYVEKYVEFNDSNIKCINKNIELDIGGKKGLYNIEEFKDHMIIGFGETVHGLSEFNKLSVNIIKFLIENRNCKLVLFELPFELGLRVNDYILGKTEEDMNKLLSLYLYDNETLSNFIQWLKVYNSKNDIKVNFSGIDVVYPKSGDNLVAYMKNQHQQSIELDSLIKMLESPARYLKIIAPRYLNENEKIKSVLKNEIYLSLCQALKNREVPFFSSMGSVNEKRDSMQFENVKFAIKTYLKENQKAVIYGHYNHINKKNNSSNRLHVNNLGNRLKGYYHDNYFIVGLFIGNGEINRSDVSINSNKYSLESPPIESLENLCCKTEKDIFYCNIQNINTSSSRSIGNVYYKNQFSPYNNICRIDAIIFFRNTSKN